MTIERWAGLKGLVFAYILIPLLLIFIIPSSSSAGGHEEGLQQVVVSNMPLGIDHIITEDDVRIVFKTSTSPKEAHSLSEVVGRRVRRPIGKNNTIKMDYLDAREVVRRGDTVIIVAEKGGLKVTTKGVAKDNGSSGEMIRVENISSGKVITGRVVESGVVKVDF